MGIRYSITYCSMDKCIVVPFTEFFNKYAGHIERFPEYKQEYNKAKILIKELKLKIKELNDIVENFNNLGI